MISKEEIRKINKEKRKSISDSLLKINSDLIVSRIEKLECFRAAENILIYMAIGKEVKLDGLLDSPMNKDKKIYVPKVDGDKMDFYRFKGADSVKKGYMGILEPLSKEKFIYEPQNARESIIIMPGLAFDLTKGRAGYGGGYYDKYLADKEIFKIAVSFDDLISEELIDLDPFDIRPDLIITEKREIR